MQDGIIKGTGNSRLIKVPATIPTAWEDARAQLIAGNFPIDLIFNGIGWDTVGTLLGKANLLSDAVAAMYGLTGNDATPNKALEAILAVASQTKDGRMSATDKAKLDGVENNANNYIHPVSSGNKHVPAGGTTGQLLGYSADGTAAWKDLSYILPIGSVITMALSTVPTGFLECAGAAVSRTTYADLYAKIGTTYGSGNGSTTFNLPDLRSEFLRGWDHGRSIDAYRAIGSWQIGSDVRTDGGGYGDLNHNTENQYTLSQGSGWSYSGPGGGSSSDKQFGYIRPRNVAMMFCIKY